MVRNRPPTAALASPRRWSRPGTQRDTRRVGLARPRGPAARLRVGPRRQRHLRGRLGHDADRHARSSPSTGSRPCACGSTTPTAAARSPRARSTSTAAGRWSATCAPPRRCSACRSARARRSAGRRQARARRRARPRSALPAVRGRHGDLAVNRARSGRRAKGKPCGVRQARAPLHAWSSRAHDQAVPARGRQRHRRARPRPASRAAIAWCSTAADEVGNRSPRRAIGLRVVRLRALETSRWRDRGGAGSGCRLPRRAGSRWPRRASPTAARPGPAGTPCGAC